MKLYIKLLLLLYTININAQNDTIFVQPITATKAYQGIFGSALIQIDDAGNDGEITNPLIIAEGLDTGLLAQAGSIGDNDIRSFSASIIESFSVDLQNLITNNITTDYDIIYVNWDNGTDFIQRNAFVLQAVIDWVNDNKTGTAQNVVLGQSMGGLIARYALRDMENNSEDHDTSLYISHDAPHQGAHVPPGILHMGRHIANEFLQTPLGNINIPVEGVGNLGLATIDDLLDAPAINQMLMNSVNTNGNRNNTIHANWQTELRNMGYPQQTRNIALSNASHCAETQGLISNQSLLTLTGNGGTSDFTSLVEFFLFLGPLVGDFFNDTPTFLLGFLPGNSSLDVEFRAKAFPSSGTAQIYKGRLTYKKTLLWLVPITRTIFNVSKNSQIGDLFIDNYPGGINPSTVFLESSGYENNFLINYGFNLNVDLNFDFIPVTSALDVGSGNTPLNQADYLRIYNAANPPIGNKAIPFHNFATSFNENNSFNEPHITFNRRNGDWLATELDANPLNNEVFDCSFVCGDSQIIGPSVLCSSATYAVSVPAGTTVNWGISNTSAASITSQSGGNVTISANIGFSGDIVLTSNITSACGNVSLAKTIRVGKPDSPSSISGPSTVNTGAIVNYVAGSSNGATSYEWRLPYPFTIRTPLDYMSQDWQLQGPGDTGNARAVTGYTQKSGYVQVMGKNACGTGAAKLLYVQHATSGGGGGGIPRINPDDEVVEVSLYPNPTQGKVTVTLTNLEDYSGEPPTLIYGIRVLDQNFYERKFYNYKDQLRSQELNVSYLNTGLNYIIVYTDTGTFTKKLMVY